MADLEQLIDEAWARWPAGVERVVLGTAEAGDVARALTELLEEELSPVEDGLFYRAGVGIVAGARLADGREVVIKVHRWNVTLPRLSAIQQVQALAAATGLPAPRPLVAPRRLGRGIATVEEYLPTGPPPADARQLCRVAASGLRRFVETAAELARSAAVGRPMLLRSEDEPLWWEPHDVRFDFERTAAGAEWIDDLARQARHRLARVGGPSVIGHFDWRVQNLGWGGDDITAIYDWDSLAAASEPVLVGINAAHFPVDWSSGVADPLPTVEEMRRFVSDYGAARGRSFSADELQAADAANLAICAYGARCQHSDLELHPAVGGDRSKGWLRLLEERGPSALV